MFAISGKMLTMLALVLAGAAVPASAQERSNQVLKDRLLACDRISDRLEELACYDAIVDSLDEDKAAETTTSDSAAVQAEQAVTPATVLVPAAIAAESVAETASLAPSAVSSPSETVPVAVQSDAENEPAAIDVAESEETRKEPNFEPFEAIIVDVWRTVDDRFAVKLDNGQTWRETAGSRITIPKKGWIVEVTKARFGGYRMKIENRKRLASVKLENQGPS